MSLIKQPVRKKLHPKLLMYCNGDEEVNNNRSQIAAALCTIGSPAFEKPVSESVENNLRARQGRKRGDVENEGFVVPEKLTSLPTTVSTNVFVYLNEDNSEKKVVGEISRKGNIVRASLPLAQLPELAESQGVAFVEAGEALKAPQPIVNGSQQQPVSSAERDIPKFASEHLYGQDVLIGIIDVGGFDFSHQDFLDKNGKTRFIEIWDQGGDVHEPPSKKFNYGSRFEQKHLNKALEQASSLGVPAYELEKQSQISEDSHGTHVASIAAGNNGVCRNASIAGVLVSLADDDYDRRKSFYDSTRIADAVDYLIELAASLGKRLSINVSLGTNGHAHDGSHAIGRWIDASMCVPGRAITVAAGNAGQETSSDPQDMGYIMGRIHTSGKVQAAGLSADLDWIVAGNGRADYSENELELWFNPQDVFAVSLCTPNGKWIGPIEAGEYVENHQLPDGSFISIYNEVYHPANGANYCSIYLTPNLGSGKKVGVSAGMWTVRLHGREIRDGKFDGWIERDDPRKFNDRWLWPSYFSDRTLVDNSTVSSLGCGQRVITVANLDSKRFRINVSSSQGPTRDGRTKPDVAAPGTEIIAAKAFSQSDEQWVSMTGTSMASPYVCGVVGLMLGINGSLTAAQIEGIIRSTAKPLPGAAYAWINDAGFGSIEPERCLERAKALSVRKEVKVTN